ncbi:MFS transporter [Rhodococcus wratislaviensis]|uniref:MFS transporter n=1 Tax=Rhodococcus wratislaviensis TaxID=44752 RepID=UPI0035153AF4
MSTSENMQVANSATLFDRLENLEPGLPHRRLMFKAGLGYTFDSFDGALMTYALSALIVIWNIPTGTSGWLLSAIFFGYLIGALGAGVLADRFGRRRLMLCALVIFTVFSVLTATASTTTELFLWRVLAGIGMGAETTLIAPYIAEFLPARVRGRLVARTVGFLAFGYILAGLVAPLVIGPNPETGWRIAALLTAAPIVLLLWWRKSLPESPRYLISRGRIAEATAVIEEFERQSGSRPPSSTGNDDQGPEDTARATPPPPAQVSLTMQLAQLFSANLARTTIVLWVLWFILIGVNYGFTSWLPAMLVATKGFTITKSFVFALITSIAQVPGYYLASLLIDRFERKWLIAAYSGAAALAALGLALAEAQIWLLVCAATLSACTNGVAGIYYAYTAELYPTEIRTTGMGAASAIGRVGAIAAPITIGYVYSWAGFTNVFLALVGALTFAVVVIVVFGPRTTGRRLDKLEGETQ